MNDVGLVMPIYNQEPELLQIALNSILRQTYKEVQYVVVIDGANSQTRKSVHEILQSNPEADVKVIDKPKNEGVSKALNTGFEYLFGQDDIQYFTWASSDNFYFDCFIEKLREDLVHSPDNVGLVYSSFRHVDTAGNHILNNDLLAFRKFQEKPKEKLLDYCYVGTSFMYKKKYAKMIDGYFMEPVEDYEYWLRLTDHCDMIYIPTELMDYRVDSPKSISAQLHTTQQHRRWRYAFNLAKQQTRNRRGIPFETTVIYPVEAFTSHSITEYEHILEQSYSNYKLIILDLTEDARAVQEFQLISDPRVTFFRLPHASLEEALRFGLKAADTPFTLLYGHNSIPIALDSVTILMDVLALLSQREQWADAASAYFLRLSPAMPGQEVFQSNAGPAGYKALSMANQPEFGSLYRTDMLKRIVDSNTDH